VKLHNRYKTKDTNSLTKNNTTATRKQQLVQNGFPVYISDYQDWKRWRDIYVREDLYLWVQFVLPMDTVCNGRGTTGFRSILGLGNTRCTYSHSLYVLVNQIKCSILWYEQNTRLFGSWNKSNSYSVINLDCLEITMQELIALFH